MKRDGSTTIALLALVTSLVAVLFSTGIAIYVATYLDNTKDIAQSLRELAQALEKR